MFAFDWKRAFIGTGYAVGAVAGVAGLVWFLNYMADTFAPYLIVITLFILALIICFVIIGFTYGAASDISKNHFEIKGMDQDTLDEFRAAFEVETNAEAIRRALTLARVAVRYALPDHTITIIDGDGDTKKVMLRD